MTARRTWKKNEQEIAEDHGTQRNPFSGGMSKETRSDSRHPILFIEDKYTNAPLPAETLLDKTVELAAAEDKIPVLVFTKKGKQGGNTKIKTKKRVVVLRYEDYLSMMKPEFRFATASKSSRSIGEAQNE